MPWFAILVVLSGLPWASMFPWKTCCSSALGLASSERSSQPFWLGGAPLWAPTDPGLSPSFIMSVMPGWTFKDTCPWAHVSLTHKYIRKDHWRAPPRGHWGSERVMACSGAHGGSEGDTGLDRSNQSHHTSCSFNLGLHVVFYSLLKTLLKELESDKYIFFRIIHYFKEVLVCWCLLFLQKLWIWREKTDIQNVKFPNYNATF